MESGIYKITFASGHFYIGKSENVYKRWQNHRKHLEQGKHTKKMQWAYNSYGAPQFEHLWALHPDHIDLYESLLIHTLWDEDKILNTTKPKPMPPATQQALDGLLNKTVNGVNIMQLSTVEQLEALDQLYKTCKEFEIKLNKMLSTDKILQELETLREQLNHLKTLSWWQRLFYKP